MHRHVLIRLRRSEAGSISLTALILLCALGAFMYALYTSFSTDPDRFGRVPIPSSGTLVSLPGAETGINLVGPLAVGDAIAAPANMRILVTNPTTGVALNVNSLGADPVEREGEMIRPVARVDPPGAGIYKVQVVGTVPVAMRPAQLAFGESPLGAIGDRFTELSRTLNGPLGIACVALLLSAVFVPRLRRALGSRS